VDSYLQQLNREHNANPGDIVAATRLIAALRRILAGESNDYVRYTPRNLGCDILPDGELWCVTGVSDTLRRRSMGVLEWCFDEEDAYTLMQMMMRDPDYSELHHHKYQSLAEL